MRSIKKTAVSWCPFILFRSYCNAAPLLAGHSSIAVFALPLICVLLVCAVVGPSISAETQNVANLRQRAEAGSAEAQFELARAYYSGEGVARDPKQGLEWLLKSASQGYVGAEFALGVIYQAPREQSVSQNPHEAAYWFRKAARHQNKEAQARLSTMFNQGLISQQEANWQSYEPTKPGKKNKSMSFSLAEVERGLLGGITSKRMASLVSTFGVGFRLNAAIRERLLREGADDNLFNAISASKE